VIAPTVRSSIDRRLLLNYRVDPDVVAATLPSPFRPLLVHGYGVAGICLIRLRDVRPVGVPRWVGVTSENAAHRVAVEWDGEAGTVAGVYIPRRDTSSRLTTMLGGRAFPGVHQRAHFDVDEGDGQYRIALASRDGSVRVAVAARVAGGVMPGSVFGTVDEASRFFRYAPVGYSATADDTRLDGVELETDDWNIEPLQVDDASSTFFDDVDRFPPGTAILDSAFLMRGLAATWHPKPTLRVPALSGRQVRTITPRKVVGVDRSS
jgi:uncharacterized protein DUF2071